MLVSKTVHQVFIIMISVFLATLSYAYEVRIDFGNQGTNPTGNWNVIADSNRNNQVNNLIDFTTGLTTPIGISGAGWQDGSIVISAPWNSGNDKDWIANDAVKDIFYSFDPATLTFIGLSPGQRYTIDILSAYNWEGSPTNDTMDIQVNGQFADSNANGTPGQFGDNWNAQTQGYEAANYLTWNAAVADASGEIHVTFNPVSPQPAVDLTAARIQGPIQQQAVPTMTAWGMIIFVALAGFGAIYFMRRQKTVKS